MKLEIVKKKGIKVNDCSADTKNSVEIIKQSGKFK